jgi:hypothetical protein
LNVSWLINGTKVFNETGVITSSYTNTSAALGMWNVSALAQNADGSDMRTWIWNVTTPTDILSYYRGLGSNPNVVETTDLLKAADDWSKNVAPPGFPSPITTQQLLTLADEWSST